MNEVATKQEAQRTTSPAEMIRIALTEKGDLDKLEKLLTIQERYEANEARKAYHRAMSDFKANPIEIEKDKKVGYDSKSGGKVGYSHASLANVVTTITRELSKFGLSSSWRTAQENGLIIVTCKITHEFGHSEETSLAAQPDSSGSKNSIQAIGSTVTYLERYTLLAALGLATQEQDDDAKSAIDDFLDAWKIEELRNMLKERQLTEANLLKYMSVEKIEDIKLKDYNKAINAVKSATKTSKT